MANPLSGGDEIVVSQTTSEHERPRLIGITGGPASLIINSRPIVTLKANGDIEFGAGIEPSEAARQLWAFLVHMNPLRGQVTALEAKNAELRGILGYIAIAEVCEIESQGRTLFLRLPDGVNPIWVREQAEKLYDQGASEHNE